jgi:hypothetical protein
MPKPVSILSLLYLAAATFSAAQQVAPIPHEQLTIPPLGPVLQGERVGGHGAANLWWSYRGAPADGLDSVRVTITPIAYEHKDSNFVYWAFDDRFVHGESYYMGLQPNGSLPNGGIGKMALFSAFGPGTSSDTRACRTGADGGAGTSCHIPYAWVVGHSYELTVALVVEDKSSTLWEGAVYDVSARAKTVIGRIRVDRSKGYLGNTGGISFDELYETQIPCAKQPASRVLFYAPTGYRNGVAYPGTLRAANALSGCNPVFHGDGKTYVYVDVGH